MGRKQVRKSGRQRTEDHPPATDPTDRPTQPPTPTNIRYLVESCLLHRINTATVAVILIRAEQLACADLRALCREFMMTLEVDALMSVFTDNLELAREEDSDAALLPAQTVAEVRVLALCFVMCAVCCVCLLYTSPSPRDRG